MDIKQSKASSRILIGITDKLPSFHFQRKQPYEFDLTITHCPGVTNRITTRLAELLPLRRLDVRGTKIASRGEAVIKRKRPNCEVISDPIPLAEGEEQDPVQLDLLGNDRIFIIQAAEPNFL